MLCFADVLDHGVEGVCNLDPLTLESGRGEGITTVDRLCMFQCAASGS